jgi:hypothetical protein
VADRADDRRDFVPVRSDRGAPSGEQPPGLASSSCISPRSPGPADGGDAKDCDRYPASENWRRQDHSICGGRRKAPLQWRFAATAHSGPRRLRNSIASRPAAARPCARIWSTMTRRSTTTGKAPPPPTPSSPVMQRSNPCGSGAASTMISVGRSPSTERVHYPGSKPLNGVAASQAGSVPANRMIRTTKNPAGDAERGFSCGLVAGTGFEPVTFRL